MELTLHRVDYAQVGTLARKCLKVLPGGGPPNTPQKVAVGAQNGIVFCFGRKKSDTVVSFKTLPGPKIDALVLGGALGQMQDKIFVASANTVKGYTKKGKQFFGFETNLTESISSMYVYGIDMLLCTNYTFNHYHDCKDANYFLCGDRINDVLCLPVVEGSWVGRGLTPVIACDDRTIKVLDGSTLAYAIEVGGAPSVMMLYQNTGGLKGQEVLYGTRDGKIGATALDCYDITGNGVMDIVVGRDDGSVEIFQLDENERPQLLQTFHCNESVTGLQCGRIGSSNFDEIVVATYAGWIFGLTTEPAQKALTQQQSQMPSQYRPSNPDLEAKVQQLRQELEQLQNEVAAERERYQQTTHDEQGYSAVPVFAVNDRFTLNKEEAAYTLSVELQVAIDYVLLQCDVPVDLLDVEKNSAVVSLTPCPAAAASDASSVLASRNALLATYRCQANTTRLEVKIRSIEGQYGVLLAYISPRMHPKTCQVRQYQIKPLSLHQRTHTFDDSRPQNSLKITGQFSLAEAHSWVVFCLPEIPEKPPIADHATLCFLSTFTNTQLECTYMKGSAIFRSDSISTIAILKDVLSKEATRKKLRFDLTCDINDDSVAHTLQLIHPKLEYQLNLAKKVHLIDALRELTVNDSDETFLSGEYLEILKNADKLQTEYKRQQAHLERIYGIITDMYIDKFKFKGVNVKSRVPQLLQILDNYNLDALLRFFSAGAN